MQDNHHTKDNFKKLSLITLTCIQVQFKVAGIFLNKVVIKIIYGFVTNH